MGFHADTFAATSKIRVAAAAYPMLNPGPTATATYNGYVDLQSATDGGGSVNNAYKVVPIGAGVMPACIFGFLTLTRTGSSGDMRVIAKLRKKIGTYVSDVSFA